MKEYCKDMGFDIVISNVFITIIKALDKVYLDWIQAEREKAQPKRDAIRTHKQAE